MIVADCQMHSREASQQRSVGGPLLRASYLHSKNLPKALLIYPDCGQERHGRNPCARTHLQVGGVQIRRGIFLLQRALPPLFLLLFETRGDAAYGILADPYLAQGVSDPCYFPYPEILDRYISRIASSTSPVILL
jgi:hypothetical protein